MKNDLKISELICTRISHDLIGNIGAFANAVELLEDDDDEFLEEIKSTLKTSSGILNARLKFFRMAFGLSSAGLDKNDIVKQISADYIASLNINNPIYLYTDFISEAHSRETMLGAMIAADTIIKGGKISVTNIDKCIQISASSEYSLSKSKIDTMEGIVNGIIPSDNLSLYAPLFYLIDLGRSVSIEHSDKLLITIK